MTKILFCEYLQKKKLKKHYYKDKENVILVINAKLIENIKTCLIDTNVLVRVYIE